MALAAGTHLGPYEVTAQIGVGGMEQLHPKDLFYQILDGLRSLTSYDHSSALLIRDESGEAFELVAEQIAWTKAKSQRIGLRIGLSDPVRLVLETGLIHGFDRRGEQWQEWNGNPVAMWLRRSKSPR